MITFKQFYLTEIKRDGTPDYHGLPDDTHPGSNLERTLRSKSRPSAWRPKHKEWMSKAEWDRLKRQKSEDEDETDEEMPMTVFAGPGEAEASNKGRKMRANIPEQPNVDGAPPIINSPGPNYTNQPSLGVTKFRTKKNKNIVRGLYKTDV